MVVASALGCFVLTHLKLKRALSTCRTMVRSGLTCHLPRGAALTCSNPETGRSGAALGATASRDVDDGWRRNGSPTASPWATPGQKNLHRRHLFLHELQPLGNYNSLRRYTSSCDADGGDAHPSQHYKLHWFYPTLPFVPVHVSIGQYPCGS